MCVPLLLLHTASGFAVRAAAGRSAAAPLRAVAAQASEYQSMLGDAKAALIDACTVADMGRIAEFRPSVLEAIEQIEPLNPTPKPLEAPDLLTGCWRLIYTTSDSILGTTRPRPFRPRYKRILQSIDARQLAAKNEEWVLLGLLKNMVRARLTTTGELWTCSSCALASAGSGYLRPRACSRRPTSTTRCASRAVTRATCSSS